MLEAVMRYINNRFDYDADGMPYCGKSGRFKIQNGTLEVKELLEGQYFWIEGSVLNDGLHQYPDEDMNDEEFNGRVVFLVVPKAVSSIAEEIADWNDRNAEILATPYQSESFGGYSYTKANGGTDGTNAEAWQLQFGARLKPYRKLSREWV